MPLGCIVRCRMSENVVGSIDGVGPIFYFPFIEYLCDVVDRTPEVGCRPRTYPIRKRMRPARFVLPLYIYWAWCCRRLLSAPRDCGFVTARPRSTSVPPIRSFRDGLRPIRAVSIWSSTFRSIPRRRSAISSVSRTTPITESTISSTTDRGRRSSSDSMTRGAAA